MTIMKVVLIQLILIMRNCWYMFLMIYESFGSLLKLTYKKALLESKAFIYVLLMNCKLIIVY